ncbi:hypothetical protein U1839_06220 [Sphingomonas sp. RT2P30]|uniref:hypothetical protein n=1 Tax=Parasphingomonas halimpatiens TaxID=3096162 RepID=UPI002FC88ABF
MTLWLHTQALYPSLKDTGVDWASDQSIWAAYKFVQALKGRPISGYAYLRRPNGIQVKINEASGVGAFTVFGEWAALRLAEIPITAASLVPVPSSDCLAHGADAKGNALAAAVRAHAAGMSLAPVLCWREHWPKAAEGGERDPDALLPNLSVRAILPQQQVVLIDDVATSGGHLIACARALRARGLHVEHAICAARTSHHVPEGGMFHAEVVDLEAPALALGW